MRFKAHFLVLIVAGCAVSMIWPQTEQSKSLVINGRIVKAGVIVVGGKTYVAVGTLAQLTNGSVSYQGNRVVLTLPGSPRSPEARAQEPASNTALSSGFMKAGIDEIHLLQEWATPIANAIQNGYPVTENWVAAYKSKATNGLHLASAALSTSGDGDAYQLLAKEFERVSEWTNNLLEARKSMNTAQYAMSPNALEADPLSQKITKCAHFLAPMLASGNYRDDGSCY